MGIEEGGSSSSSAELTPLLGARASKQLVENVVVTLLGRLVDQSRLESRDTAQNVGEPNNITNREATERKATAEEERTRSRRSGGRGGAVGVAREVWNEQRVSRRGCTDKVIGEKDVHCIIRAPEMVPPLLKWISMNLPCSVPPHTQQGTASRQFFTSCPPPSSRWLLFRSAPAWRVATYEARGVVVPDRLGVTKGLEKGRRLEDLLLDLRVLAGTCGEELQDELRRLRFARTGLATIGAHPTTSIIKIGQIGRELKESLELIMIMVMMAVAVAVLCWCGGGGWKT
jgi:hypothetical protein